MNKVCRVCGEVKPVHDFFMKDRCKDGREGRCKACHTKEDSATCVRLQREEDLLRQQIIQQVLMGSKKCVKCTVEKPVEEFNRAKRNSDGLNSWCKSCMRTYAKVVSTPKRHSRKREEREAKRKQARDYARFKSYGLTEVDFIVKRELQDNKCKLCDKPFGEKTPVVDHNHDTGQVRGLLHSNCNVLLAMAGDDITMLQAAISYLQQDPAKVVGEFTWQG